MEFQFCVKSLDGVFWQVSYYISLTLMTNVWIKIKNIFGMSYVFLMMVQLIGFRICIFVVCLINKVIH